MQQIIEWNHKLNSTVVPSGQLNLILPQLYLHHLNFGCFDEPPQSGAVVYCHSPHAP